MAKSWVLKVTRIREEKRAGAASARTISTYQVFHGSSAVSGLSGFFAERQGPGDNGPSGRTNKRRIEAKTYGLSTHDGSSNDKYKTIGYSTSSDISALPRPSIRFLNTGSRSGILFHPASGYLWSIGCLNPAASLTGPNDNIGWLDSRSRVIALIDDMKSYLGSEFPTSNNVTIPHASCVIVGEP